LFSANRSAEALRHFKACAQHSKVNILKLNILNSTF
jgi:hypothetical protein